MNPFSLSGRTIFVTGGTQGVGAAICKSIAQAGGNLVIQGLRADAAAEETVAVCREAGAHVDLLTYNLLAEDPTSAVDQRADKLAAMALGVNPAIDGLVNNAGTYQDGEFVELTAAVYYRTMQLNVAAGLFLTQAFARHWIAGNQPAQVVFTGSINGLLSEPQHVSYDASKGAVAALVRSLCVELAPHNIRVNSMAPGLVRTPMTGALETNQKLTRWMELHTPNGSVPAADVCGPPVVFLLSQAAAHIHGQTLYVDGGMSSWQQPDPPA
ncbi:SDR family NAD(P)-dependent oxidoreductase [Planctomycetaceae bacterium SH139]